MFTHAHIFHTFFFINIVYKLLFRESIIFILYTCSIWQVISDHLIVNLLESLRHLKSFVMCHCLGETSSSIFKVSMPNLRKLRLERVAPWMNNADLVTLGQNCENLSELSLVGCRLLNSGLWSSSACFTPIRLGISSFSATFSHVDQKVHISMQSNLWDKC